jgi:large subunit ribosomal protein L6
MALSRIGKKPITIPKGIKIEVSGNAVGISGPKGTLRREFVGVSVQVEGDKLLVSANAQETKNDKALHGLARALLQNMVKGAATGFQRELEITGVGYRADVKSDVLEMSLGYSHPVRYRLPAGVVAKVEKQTKILLESADRELLGHVAATVRGFRPPDPYKAKGVKYSDEVIRRKAGKTGAKGGKK